MAERARRSLERDLERINHQADAPRITSPVGRPVHEEKNRAGRKGYKSILMQEFVPQGFEKEEKPYDPFGLNETTQPDVPFWRKGVGGAGRRRDTFSRESAYRGHTLVALPDHQKDPSRTQELGFYVDGSGKPRQEPQRPTATPVEARAHLGATRRNDQSKIDKLRFSCEGLVEKGKWEEAAVIAEMAAHAMWAGCLQQLGQFEEAALEFKKAKLCTQEATAPLEEPFSDDDDDGSDVVSGEERVLQDVEDMMQKLKMEYSAPGEYATRLAKRTVKPSPAEVVPAASKSIKSTFMSELSAFKQNLLGQMNKTSSTLPGARSPPESEGSPSRSPSASCEPTAVDHEFSMARHTMLPPSLQLGVCAQQGWRNLPLLDGRQGSSSTEAPTLETVFPEGLPPRHDPSSHAGGSTQMTKPKPYWLTEHKIDEVLQKAEEARVTAGQSLTTKIGGEEPVPDRASSRQSHRDDLGKTWDSTLGFPGRAMKSAPAEQQRQSYTFWQDSMAGIRQMPSIHVQPKEAAFSPVLLKAVAGVQTEGALAKAKAVRRKARQL